MEPIVQNKEKSHDHSGCKHPPLQEDEWACINCMRMNVKNTRLQLNPVNKESFFCCQNVIPYGTGRNLKLDEQMPENKGRCGYIRDFNCCVGWERKLPDNNYSTMITYEQSDVWKCCKCAGFSKKDVKTCPYQITKSKFRPEKGFWSEKAYCNHARCQESCTNGSDILEYNTRLLEHYKIMLPSDIYECIYLYGNGKYDEIIKGPYHDDASCIDYYVNACFYRNEFQKAKEALKKLYDKKEISDNRFFSLMDMIVTRENFNKK